MASQQQSRIQSYLERNKIGPLFEVSSFIYKEFEHFIEPRTGHVQAEYSSLLT